MTKVTSECWDYWAVMERRVDAAEPDSGIMRMANAMVSSAAILEENWPEEMKALRLYYGAYQNCPRKRSDRLVQSEQPRRKFYALKERGEMAMQGAVDAQASLDEKSKGFQGEDIKKFPPIQTPVERAVDPYIYAIACIPSPESVCVKIGRSYDVEHRLMELQIANPFALKLLGKVRAPAETEPEIHKRLKKAGCYQRGEWFNPTDSFFMILDDYGFDLVADDLGEG